MQRPNHVLLTGGTGCLGSRILDELLKDGYHVRATARPKKVHFITDTFPNAGDQLEVYEMQDLVIGDWKKALEGIDAVIHVATPVYHPWVTGQEIYDASTVGMRRILAAVGESPTVKKFVYTGSIGAFFKMDFSNVLSDITFDENTYSELEDLDPVTTPPSGIYLGCKAISEKIMWKAADQYPHIDFTSILCSSVYGKFLDKYPFPTQEDELNANKFYYHFIKTENGTFPPVPMIAQVHNKDNARAHVLALTAKKLEDGRRKRLIITSGDMRWDDAVEHLKVNRPALVGRLPDMSKVTLAPHHFKLDTKMTEEVIRMKKDDMIPWQHTLLESIDWLVEWEKKMGIKV